MCTFRLPYSVYPILNFASAEQFGIASLGLGDQANENTGFGLISDSRCRLRGEDPRGVSTSHPPLPKAGSPSLPPNRHDRPGVRVGGGSPRSVSRIVRSDYRG